MVMHHEVGILGIPQHSNGVVVAHVRFEGDIINPPPSDGDQALYLPSLLRQGAYATELKPAATHLATAYVGEEVPKLGTEFFRLGLTVPSGGVVHPGTTEHPMDAGHGELALAEIDGTVSTVVTTAGTSDHQLGFNRLVAPAAVDHVNLSHPPQHLLPDATTLDGAAEAVPGNVYEYHQDQHGRYERVGVLILDEDRGISRR